LDRLSVHDVEEYVAVCIQLGTPPRVKELAGRCGCTPLQLARHCAVFLESEILSQYLRRRHLELASCQQIEGDLQVTEERARALGYGCARTLRRALARQGSSKTQR
jgi:AraC-like DNA-binding protein